MSLRKSFREKVRLCVKNEDDSEGCEKSQGCESTCEFQSWVMVTGTGSPHLHMSILVNVVGKQQFHELLRGRVNGVINLQYSQWE